MSDTSLKAAETAAVNIAMLSDTAEKRERFEACRATHRFMSFIGKELVIYWYNSANQVASKQTLRCTDVGLEGNDGFESTWEQEDGKPLHISHTPTEVAPGVFLWMTFYSDVQLTTFRGQPNVRFSMLYRCSSHPRVRLPGVYYIQERAAFEAEHGR